MNAAALQASNSELIGLAEDLQEEVESLRDLLGRCVGILDGTIEESKRSIEYGEEDPFRMGEWFEEDELDTLEAARAILNETKDNKK